MGLIDVASGNSVWRGMDYYENKKVISWEKTGDNTYLHCILQQNRRRQRAS